MSDSGHTFTEESVRRIEDTVHAVESSSLGGRRAKSRHRRREEKADVTDVYAKIAGDNGDGTYNATEQIWDASANDWTDKTNGRTFDSNSDTEPPIQEENNVQGLPDGGEVVVQIQKHVDDEGGKHWIFRTRIQGVWEATADASSGTITLKRLNSDGTLAGAEQSFDVI